MLFEGVFVRKCEMSYSFECDFVGVFPRNRAPTTCEGLMAPGLLISSTIDRRSSVSLILAHLRSDILEGARPDGLFVPPFCREMTEAARLCVRDNVSAWEHVDPPSGLSPSEDRVAMFCLSWAPIISFERIKQNRLYKIRKGDRELGALRRPGRDENWHFFRPFIDGSRVGDWPNLEAARVGVTQLLEKM